MNICLICGHSFFDYLLTGTDKSTFEPGEFKLYKCKQCGLIQQNPIPTYDELARFYPSTYQGNLTKNIYQIKNKNKSISEIYTKTYTFFKDFFAPYPSILKEVLSLKKNIKTSLDVGCGNGKFMYFLNQNTKFKTYGIDFDEEAISYIKDSYSLPCEAVNIDNFSTNKKYDFVSMIHFLEHDLNPVKTLSKVSEIISKDGLLYIEVPNSSSILFDIFGKDWLALDLPRHVTHFNSKNLKNILNNCGFEVIKVKYRYFEYSMLFSLIYKLNISKFVSKMRSKYPFFAISLFALELLIERPLSLLVLPITIFGKTDTIRVYARLQNI